MKGKNILIIGASRGIGRDISEYLLSLGANIVVVARKEITLCPLKELSPKHVMIYPYDMSNLDNIETIFQFCMDNHIKLDGLVYSAGVSVDCPVKMLEAEHTKQVYNINILGYIQAVRFFGLKKYSNENSSIVVLSSAASKICEKGMVEYASSKSAVNAATNVLSKELARRKIRVNAIAPGMVDTDMYRNTVDKIDDYETYLQKMQPYGVIPVRQISYLIKFLLSAESQYITGAVIPVSAGTNIQN